MTDKLKNILLGLFVLTGVSLIIGMIVFLNPKIGDGKKTLLVRFANIAGITHGTRVSFAGKPVGEVVAIQEIKDARDVPSDGSGKVYFYLLTLKVDSHVNVYSYDDIAMRTTGLMGEKSVAILPKLAPEGHQAHLITDQIMTASSVDPLENTFNQVAKVSNKLETSLTHLDTWFQKTQKPLTESVESLHAFLDQGNNLLGEAVDTNLISRISQSSALLNDNLSLLHTSLDQDQLLHKVATLASTMNDVADNFNFEGKAALENIRQITADLSGGVGTIGRLITGEDFYLRLSSLLSKGETLMNDINHYGLLFQYDKSWQRSRTKRANILKSLETPRDFRGYFEGEVDSIRTSLGRLTELMDYAGSAKERISSDESFKQQFGTLLRSVQSLSDSLKLYNEDLIVGNND